MLKLRYSTTSPYVRKVSVSIIELGLEDSVENVLTNPWAPETDLAEDNPLGKVPALITESGEVIFDSPVICEYLDGLQDETGLFPEDREERLKVLRQQAIGDGILDAAIGRLLECRRPAESQLDSIAERYRIAVNRSLDLLEQEIEEAANGLTIGDITIGVALEYLDFRFPADDWRQNRPRLTRWHQSLESRNSFTQTKPRE